MSGALAEGELTSKQIGDPVYLGASGLTTTKPATGFLVGQIERITDGLVRFDLTLTHIPVASE